MRSAHLFIHMNVSHVMMRDVPVVELESTVHDAVSKMVGSSAGCILVEDRGIPVGTLTGKDISYLIIQDKNIKRLKIKEAMYRPVQSIGVDVPVPDALKIMELKEIHAMAVVDENSSTVGFVNLSDLVSACEKRYAEFLNTKLAEYRQIGEKLRVSEEKYRKLVSTTTDAIMVFDADSRRFMEVNRACEELYGYSKEEFLNQITHNDITAERNLTEESIKRTFEGSLKRISRRYHRKKDGTVFPVEISASLLELEGRIAFCGIVRDITDRIATEERLKTSLKEKEVLLREVNHRVKSNLQLSYSLLNLQKAFMKDKNVLNMIEVHQNRIMALSLVHEHVYQSENLASIDLGYYINELVNRLFRFYEVDTNNIILKVDVKDILFDVNYAIPFGLIVNEITVNFLECASSDERDTEINIIVSSTDECRIELIMSINNTATLKDPYMKKPESPGLQIINTLVSHLKGKVEVTKNGGIRFHITFSKRK